ncbi:MAG: hypothetical protein CM15mP52_2780 [Candidatus Neomarinimicrobiota bacterium]|nr:MAG: hypothetical protein CM15mP52_2780 [Candidatus Neomarinimicrobiota bacterium]
MNLGFNIKIWVRLRTLVGNHFFCMETGRPNIMKEREISKEISVKKLRKINGSHITPLTNFDGIMILKKGFKKSMECG